MRESVSKAHELSGRRLVAFDFDGTLADTKPQIVRVARQVLLERGLTDEQLVDVGEIIGPPFPQAFMMVFGLSENDASEVTDAYRAIYARLGPKAWPLFDGVTKLLQRLKDRGKVLATVSSKRLEILRRGLVDNGILESFDVVLGSDSDRPQTKAQALLEAIESWTRSWWAIDAMMSRRHAPATCPAWAWSLATRPSRASLSAPGRAWSSRLWMSCRMFFWVGQPRIDGVWH